MSTATTFERDRSPEMGSTAGNVHRIAFASVAVLAAAAVGQGEVVTQSPTAYQPVVFEFEASDVYAEIDRGGSVSEDNPFLDRRLQVVITGPDGVYDVPGYFAGDGEGGAEGRVWRAVFTPLAPGPHAFEVSFREGDEVAVELAADAGVPLDFDGEMGSFEVAPPDPEADGFFAKGKLLYEPDAGRASHYLRFTDGDFYVKAGPDSPENWLGYVGFDNTFSSNGRGPRTPDRLHRYPTHEADWTEGDPDWDSPDTPEPNDGRAIIGALNYLASTGTNVVYFLTMNIGGDGQDTWPYASPTIDGGGDPGNDNLTFDTSKLEQWELWMRHANATGQQLHVVLSEGERDNKEELDDAELGVERKLYYRQMIAWFGYLPALQWNIFEEYNIQLNVGADRVLEFAGYIKAVDPYGTPVTVHNTGTLANPTGGPWAQFFGRDDIDLTSLQQAARTTRWGLVVESFREASATVTRGAGEGPTPKRIPIHIDEPGSPTRDYNGDYDRYRKQCVWPILISGGGVECFINNEDQSLEDFRDDDGQNFDKIWREMGYALRFFEEIPFHRMRPADELLTGGTSNFDGAECFAELGRVYAVYMPDSSPTARVDLTAASGPLVRRWFNPRTGEFEGTADPIASEAQAQLGTPPSSTNDDWVALITSPAFELELDIAPPFGRRDFADLIEHLRRFDAGLETADIGPRFPDDALTIGDLERAVSVLADDS